MFAVPREIWALVLQFAECCGRKRPRSGGAETWIGAAVLRVSWAAHFAARAALTDDPAGRAYLAKRFALSRHPFPAWLTTDALAAQLRAVPPLTVRSVCRAAVVRNDPAEWSAIARAFGAAQWTAHASDLSIEALAAAVSSNVGKSKGAVVVGRAVADAYAAGKPEHADHLLLLVPPRSRRYVDLVRTNCVSAFTRGPRRTDIRLVADCVAATDDVRASMAVTRCSWASAQCREQWCAHLWNRCRARRAVKVTEAVVVHRFVGNDAILGWLDGFVSWCSLLTLQACPVETSVPYNWHTVVCESMLNPDVAVPLFVWSMRPDPTQLYRGFGHCAAVGVAPRPENVAALLALNALPPARRAVVELVYLSPSDTDLLGVADAFVEGLPTEGMVRKFGDKLRASEPLAEALTLAVPANAPTYDPLLRVLRALPHRGVWRALICHHNWNVAQKRRVV